jgi:hypothetical protein
MQVAHQTLQVEGNRYCFNQSKRYPEEIISVKRYVNINDINLTEDQLPDTIKRVQRDCLNNWYIDDNDSSIYVVKHEDKYGVFANHQAI